jgi:biopolymer transport protein ExbD
VIVRRRWILVAVAVLLLGACLCYLLLLCPRTETVTTIITDLDFLREPPLDLPSVSSPGIGRWKLDECVITLSLHPDGRITWEGNALDETLLEGLFRRVADQGRNFEDPYQPCLAQILLRCDRRTPWRSVRTVLAAALDPEIRLNRMHFSVQDPAGRFELTLPLLPEGVLGERVRSTTRFEPVVNVVVSTREGEAWAALDGALDESVRGRLARLSVEDDVPAGFAIRVVDRLRAAGAGKIAYLPPDREDPAAPVVRLRAPTTE